jgi:ribosomal protein S24E
MEITIEKTSENPFLQRKEVHGKVSFQGATPSQKQLADALATKLGAKADAIFVAHVFTEFGAQSATFEAHVYPSKEQLDKVVKLGKKAKEKAAKAAPAPAAAPAEAKPAESPKAEEKKEEPKAEEKKEAPKVEEKKEAAKA